MKVRITILTLLFFVSGILVPALADHLDSDQTLISAAKDNDHDVTVYITKTGEKYHAADVGISRRVLLRFR